MSKYQKIWNLTGKYDFNFDLILYHDMICLICKKLLRNASQSPCGCRYCYQCIEEYLRNEDKYCPRQCADCQEQKINLYRDVTIDHAANRKIVMIKVKCPEPSCLDMLELRDMVDHIKSHKLLCPFINVGCNQPRCYMGAMKTHFRDEEYSHNTLLMESMNEIKDEIGEIKSSNCVSFELSEQLSDEITTITEEIAYLKDESLRMINLKLLKFNEDLKQKDNMIKELQMKVEELNKKCNVDVLMLQWDQEDLKRDLAHLQQTSCPLYKVENREDFSSTLFVNDNNPPLYNDPLENLCPFEWKINNFTEQMYNATNGVNLSIFSELFYSHKNGYKMQLRIDPNGVDKGDYSHVAVGFSIVCGEYDSQLEWPMSRKVKIALINQKTGLIHTSKTFQLESVEKKFKCIFYKPSSRFEYDEDYFFGTTKFIKIKSLLNNGKILCGDSVVFKCFVD